MTTFAEIRDQFEAAFDAAVRTGRVQASSRHVWEGAARKAPVTAIRALVGLTETTSSDQVFARPAGRVAPDGTTVLLDPSIDLDELRADPIEPARAWRAFRESDALVRTHAGPLSGYDTSQIDPPQAFIDALKVRVDVGIDMVATRQLELHRAEQERLERLDWVRSQPTFSELQRERDRPATEEERRAWARHVQEAKAENAQQPGVTYGYSIARGVTVPHLPLDEFVAQYRAERGR